MTMIILLFTLAFQPLAAQSASLSGTVRDYSGRSIDSIRVSLLDDNYQTLRTVSTYGGRYQFKGISRGAYYVKVETFNTPYEEQMSPRLDLVPAKIYNSGSEDFYHDFILRPKKDAVLP